ncbi:MAG TPA: hypothetical protein VFK06_04905 [Candidatus Angelobacter sp.]|nr:hypothetical protein [Candidatus Angelobacter sp.]
MVGGIHNMQSENATPEQKQQFVRQWSGLAHTDGDCAQKCSQHIELNSFVARHREFLGNHPRLLDLYLLAGGHLATVMVDFELWAGVPQYAGVDLLLYVEPTHRSEDNFGGMGYTLMGKIYFLTRVQPEERPNRISPLHPTYRFYKADGCFDCSDFAVGFLPGASQTDINRLAQFDFSCLTRWRHPCRTRSDLMPAAWQQKLQDDQYENEPYKNVQH